MIWLVDIVPVPSITRFTWLSVVNLPISTVPPLRAVMLAGPFEVLLALKLVMPLRLTTLLVPSASTWTEPVV